MVAITPNSCWAINRRDAETETVIYKVRASADYYATDLQVMVAYVPMQGVHTIYATIGDLFAWLSVAGLVVLIGVAFVRRPKADEVGAAAPRGEPLPVS